MDIHDLKDVIHTNVDVHMDIQVRIPMIGHPTMDIPVNLISMSGYLCFCGCPQSMIVWISMHGHAMILEPGDPCKRN